MSTLALGKDFVYNIYRVAEHFLLNKRYNNERGVQNWRM
jgi:hypothetical protein